jgi:hypothetical protein
MKHKQINGNPYLWSNTLELSKFQMDTLEVEHDWSYVHPFTRWNNEHQYESINLLMHGVQFRNPLLTMPKPLRSLLRQSSLVSTK